VSSVRLVDGGEVEPLLPRHQHKVSGVSRRWVELRGPAPDRDRRDPLLADADSGTQQITRPSGAGHGGRIPKGREPRPRRSRGEPRSGSVTRSERSEWSGTRGSNPRPSAWESGNTPSSDSYLRVDTGDDLSPGIPFQPVSTRESWGQSGDREEPTVRRRRGGSCAGPRASRPGRTRRRRVPAHRDRGAPPRSSQRILPQPGRRRPRLSVPQSFAVRGGRAR
jgi:hypothetical protein